MNRLPNHLLFATLLGAASMSSFAGTRPAAERTLLLRLDPVAVSAKRIVGKEFAEASSLDAKSGTLKLVVRQGVSVETAARALARRREVLEVRTPGGKLVSAAHDLRSVSALSGIIKRLGGDEKPSYEERREEAENHEEKGAGTEYLEALRAWIKPRAYPYDRIDADAYDAAIAQAKKMKAATIGNGKGGGTKAAAVAVVPGVTGKWQFVGPKNLNTPYTTYYGQRPTSGRVNAVAYDPKNTKIIYAGAPQGGVMKSTDGGVSWTPIGDSWGYNTVSCIAVDPKSTSTIYVGTGDFQGLVGAYTMGIMKSTDGGNTWTNLGASLFGGAAVSAIAIDPNNSSILTITTGRGSDGVGKVYRSTNGGTSWTTAINTLANWSSASYAVADSSGKRSLYVTGNGVLYRSDDSGATWTSLTAPGTANSFNLPFIAGSAVDPKTAYLMSTQDQKIYKSTDSGSTWNDITGSFPSSGNWGQGFYDWYIAAYKDGTKDHLFVGLLDIVESPDGGTTWTSVGQALTGGAKTHSDQHSFAVNPSNPNEILFGNDGGLYMATGGAGKWAITGLSANLGITQFYNVVWHPSDKTRIIGGTQDNATPVALGNLAKWENVAGGDGGFCAINPANPNIQFATIYDFSIYMTKDNWKTENYISPDTGNDPLPFITPIFQDPVNTRYLYGCTSYLWRYDVQSGTWTARLGGTQLSNGSLIHTVAVAPSNGQIIYTGSDDGQIFMSTTAGSSWRRLNSSSLPNRAITSISVNPSDPNDILVTVSGTGTKHLFECANTSAGTPAYVSRSGSGTSGLPDVPANIIERDPLKPKTTLYVGTDIGVFVSNDSGTTWANATVPLGLPNVQVNSLNANGRTGLLSAGTYGRGIWSINLGQGGMLNPSGVSAYDGTAVGGDYTSLFADDGKEFVVNSALVKGVGQSAAALVTFTDTGTGDLTTLGFDVSFWSETTAATMQVYVKNQRTNSFTLLKSFAGSKTLNKQTLSIAGTSSAPITDYLSKDGQRRIEIIVRGLVPTRTGQPTPPAFKIHVDHAAASVTTSGT